MIVRELLAVFGLEYDGKGQKQAEAGVQALHNKMTQLAGIASKIFAAGAIVTPVIALAKMASDAQENLNLLQVSFEDNADTVVEWSERAGKAMGRSQYTMRELAAEFGGLLRPMVGAGQELADMSTRLSELAVDLSSLRNISEGEALNVMRSALSGETEAIKRFGVNMQVARQESMALSMGITASYKNMTQAQKAAVRYNIMLEDLGFMTGDAANTTRQFANSTRAARDQLKDIGTDIGLFILPAIEDLLMSLRGLLEPVGKAVRAFGDWARETSLAEGVLSALALTLGFLVLPLLMKLLLAIAPLIIAAGIFAIVMDEVITTFKGGDSAISRFTAWMDKLEKEGFPGVTGAAKIALQVLSAFRDALGAAAFLAVSLVSALASGDWDQFASDVRSVGNAFLEWLPTLGKAGRVLRAIFALVSGNTEEIDTAMEGLKNIWSGRRVQIPTAPELPPPQAEAGGLARRTVTVNRGNSTYTFNVTQLPGEDSEAFAQRVKEIIDNSSSEAAQAVFNELAPEPAG